MPRGGKRPNAGRKPGVARSRAELLTEAIGPDDWIEILTHVRKLAVSSGPESLRAAALLLHYHFGQVSDSVDYILRMEKKTAEMYARHHPEAAQAQAADPNAHPSTPSAPPDSSSLPTTVGELVSKLAAMNKL